MEKPERLRKIQHIERIVLLPILATVGVAFFCLGRVQVVGESMAPTFSDGQKMMVLKAWKLTGLRVGDVVVIEPTGKRGREAQIIKRIAFIQDELGRRPWPGVLPTSRGPMLSPLLFRPEAIGKPLPPRSLLVLGDNLENSTDSREFGPIFPDEIYGKVLSR